MNYMRFDRLIIGGGIFGLYAALILAKKGETILILEKEHKFFRRASYINQARVHMGYHYPRSLYTAQKAAYYYEKFCKDFAFAINDKFVQIYAISQEDSYIDSLEFQQFCREIGIPIQECDSKKYFNPNKVQGAFITKECTFDAHLLHMFFMKELLKYKNIRILFNTTISTIAYDQQEYCLQLSNNEILKVKGIVNATYSGLNSVLSKVHLPLFSVKYELCEVILATPSSTLDGLGFTVMDGPFFSTMPFGKTQYYSLTSVCHTPHETNLNYPHFSCQKQSKTCTPENLSNCLTCLHRPKTKWEYMNSLFNKYMNPKYYLKYNYSMFVIKTILQASEEDDSRPTIIRKDSQSPSFISVFSGKVNSIYDLEEVL